jgi:hypothetical protein
MMTASPYTGMTRARPTMTLLVALAWIYVVVMVALAELFSPQGSVLGAVFTLLGWGVLPLSVVLYVMTAPARRRLRRRQEGTLPGLPSAQPDGSSHTSGDAVAPERKESR